MLRGIHMKFAFLALLLLPASGSAQIRSISDPSAWKPDPPKSAPKKAALDQTAKTQNPQTKESLTAEPAPSIADESVRNALQQGVSTQPLNLACGGGGTANKANVTSVYGTSNASGFVGSAPISLSGSSSGTIISQRQQGFADQVDVRLFSGDDRIRLPRTMLPPIHGGDAGWFKLRNVKVTPRAITASASINFMSNPKIHIDRVTGTISINGRTGDYTGYCERIQADTPAKF